MLTSAELSVLSLGGREYLPAHLLLGGEFSCLESSTFPLSRII